MLASANVGEMGNVYSVRSRAFLFFQASACAMSSAPMRDVELEEVTVNKGKFAV